MKFYFEDKYGELRKVADVESKREVCLAINAFLSAHNYKSYYTRSWIEDEGGMIYITYDVGSHSEFFKLEFNSYEAARKFLDS